MKLSGSSHFKGGVSDGPFHQSREFGQTPNNTRNRVTGLGRTICRQLPIIALLCFAGVIDAKGPQPAIQGVGFLCTDTVDCQVSTIRHAVSVKTDDGTVILGVGASINDSTDPYPISPVLFSSASPGALFELPAENTDNPNEAFLTASMITPDGLKIASRAQVPFSRTAVIVDVDPGSPAFSAPLFTNTLLDPGLAIASSAAGNISDDGTIAYGFGSTGNFIWTEGSGLSLLPVADPGEGAMVGGSNAGDGSSVLISDYICDVTFTVCSQTGYVYDKATDSNTALSPLGGDDSVQPFVMSANGKVAAGLSYISTLDPFVYFVTGQLVTWDLETGVPTALGSPDMSWHTSNFGGMTKDGKAIVVTFIDGSVHHPYLYNKNGFFKLEDVLSDAGVDLTGWVFTYDQAACPNCEDAGGTSVFGVSPDGDLIYGATLHDVDGSLVPEGYIVSGLGKNYLNNYKIKSIKSKKSKKSKK